MQGLSLMTPAPDGVERDVAESFGQRGLADHQAVERERRADPRWPGGS